MKPVNGNPAERMLESCVTVDEDWAFFERHWEPSFSYAKILVRPRSKTLCLDFRSVAFLPTARLVNKFTETQLGG